MIKIDDKIFRVLSYASQPDLIKRDRVGSYCYEYLCSLQLSKCHDVIENPYTVGSVESIKMTIAKQLIQTDKNLEYISKSIEYEQELIHFGFVRRYLDKKIDYCDNPYNLKVLYHNCIDEELKEKIFTKLKSI